MNENELNLFILCSALLLVMPIGWGLRYSFDEFMKCGNDDQCLKYHFAYLSSAIAIEIILLMVVVNCSKKTFKIKKEVGI